MKKYLKKSLDKESLREKLEQRMKTYTGELPGDISNHLRLDLSNFESFVFDNEKIKYGYVIEIISNDGLPLGTKSGERFLVTRVTDNYLNITRARNNKCETLKINVDPVVLKDVMFKVVREEL